MKSNYFKNTDHKIIKSSYKFCQKIAKSRAKNFYYSFTVLPSKKKRAMCAVYAFMRYCDDIVDEAAEPNEKKRQLLEWRGVLDDAYSGRTVGKINLLPAFRDSIENFKIPRTYFDAIIDGAEMDLTINRYSTFDDLYQYCYRVASAVGLVCLHIFGFKSNDAKKYAEYCGIAFQLTNILRDVKEDAEMGRIYLPQEDLDEFDYTEGNIRNELLNDNFRRLMAYQVDRARYFYEQAIPLLPLVNKSSQACLATMIGIYRQTLLRLVLQVI